MLSGEAAETGWTNDPAESAFSLPDRDGLVNITLTPDIERALAEQARRLGTTPEQLVIDSLREHFETTTDTPSETGDTLADSLREHIGILHSGEHVPGGARMSEGSGQKFATGLAEQRRQNG